MPSLLNAMARLDVDDCGGAREREVRDGLAEQGAMGLDQPAHTLGLSEGEATSPMAMLARAGKVRIRQVELAA